MKFIFCYWDEPKILNQQKHETENYTNRDESPSKKEEV